jgi:hypothetical protein
MPRTAEVMDEARRLIERRLAELDDERTRLERALSGLGGEAERRGPSRPARGRGRPRRRRKGGRSAQVQKLIAANPGVAVPDIAKNLKVKPPYLYTLLGKLTKEGVVQKKGRQYFPAT